MTAIVWAIGFWPRPVPLPTGEQALEAYFNVLIIGASITVIFHLIERSKQASPSKQADQPAASAPVAPPPIAPPPIAAPPVAAPPVAAGPAPAPQPAFLDRLPAHLGSDLLALEMEDHYVRAHTALGSELILLRMRDAIAELGGIEGAQVHRSWWVARDAVEDVKRDGRNVRLVLPGGLEAPVSRTRVAELKDAGWL